MILNMRIKNDGYNGYFIPKFHYELNPIEGVWAQSKKY